MTIPVVTKVGHAVTVRLQIAQQSGPHQNAVGIVVRLILAVPVVDDTDLRSKSLDREILTVQVRHKNIVIAKFFRDVVQPAVGVFFQSAKPGQIVLILIVRSIAKHPNAKRHILEQEAPKIVRERLNPDPDAIKIEPIRHVA